MNNNFKRTFFSSLLAVLLIVSNLIGIKYTNFSGVSLSINFVAFPFIFLCYLLLVNLCNKKEASQALLSSVFIQVFILLTYVLTTNLGSQNIVPDFANYVNVVFGIDEVYIMINLIAIMVSTYILQYVYDYFRIIRYKMIGVVISLFLAIIVYGLITIPVINYGFGINIIFKIIMAHLVMSLFMTVLITILFYLLKDKEYPYNDHNIFIKDVSANVSKTNIDKPIEEVIEIDFKKQVKKTSNTKAKYKKEGSKNKGNSKEKNNKKKEVSKKDVKK